jgi:hypothetical protein
MISTLTQENIAEGRKNIFHEYDAMKDQRGNLNALPELRVNFSGEVLQVNRSAEKLLAELGAESKWQAQLFFSVEFPQLLQRGCFTDVEINTENFRYCFSAVAFDEAEYVELQCYRILRNEVLNEPETTPR